MIEIMGESVKTGLIIEIIKNFPGIAVFRESISDPPFPHFFVQQISLNWNEERKEHFWLNYLMNVRYRQIADPVLDPNLQRNLDGIGLKLLELSRIKLGQFVIPIRNPRIEKVDGVLHYFNNFILQVTYPEIEKIMQETLKLTIDLKVNMKGEDIRWPEVENGWHKIG